MPIKRKLERTKPAGAAELTKLLHDEWTNPKPDGQPLIIVEGDARDPVHIYVIWDRWGDLNQTERSEIIMDVVDSLVGDARLPAHAPVTVAMGLTADEAKRIGIKAD